MNIVLTKSHQLQGIISSNQQVLPFLRLLRVLRLLKLFQVCGEAQVENQDDLVGKWSLLHGATSKSSSDDHEIVKLKPLPICSIVLVC